MKNTLIPPRLTIGDKIGIIAPSSYVDLPEEIIQKGYFFLKSHGIDIVEGDNLRGRKGHTSGTIQERIKDIVSFLIDDEVKAIMSFWGGFNTNQLLQNIDFQLFAKHPKIIIGYSDFTTLLNVVNQRTGLVTYCGPSVISFCKNNFSEFTWQSFERACMSTIAKWEVTSSTGDWKIIKDGVSEGTTIAMNIQCLSSLCGTPYFPELNNKILFLEDAEEVNTELVDRALTQLKQVGALERLSGVVFGKFTKETGFSNVDSLEQLVLRIFEKYSFPILSNFDFGHSEPTETIPVGIRCTLNTNRLNVTFSVDNNEQLLHT